MTATPASTMLYRQGSEIEFQGANLDTLIVPDEDVDAAIADGWSHLADLFDADGKPVGDAPAKRGRAKADG